MIRVSSFVATLLLAGCSSQGQVQALKPITLRQYATQCAMSNIQHQKTSSSPESIDLTEESGTILPNSCSSFPTTIPANNSKNVGGSQSLARKEGTRPYQTNSQEIPHLSDISGAATLRDDGKQHSAPGGKNLLNETGVSDGLNHNSVKSQQLELAVNNGQIPSSRKIASRLPSNYQSGIALEDTKLESSMENSSSSIDDDGLPTNPETSPFKSTTIDYEDSYSDNDKSPQHAQTEKNESANPANFPQAEVINGLTDSEWLGKEASSSEAQQTEMERDQSEDNSQSNKESEKIDPTSSMQKESNKANSNVSKTWHLKWKNTDKDNENKKSGNYQE